MKLQMLVEKKAELKILQRFVEGIAEIFLFVEYIGSC